MVSALGYEQKYSTSSPTSTHLESFKIAQEEFIPIKEKIKTLVEDVKQLEDKLREMGAPYTTGRFKYNN